MLKKTKKLIPLFLCVILLTSVLFGCGGKDKNPDTTTTEAETDVKVPEGEANLIISGQTDYTIVYPSGSSNDVINEAKKLREYITENFGVTLQIKEDWLNTKNNEQPSEHEILLGKTNREESTAAADGLRANDWAVKKIGEKVAVYAVSDSQIATAVDYLINTVLAGKKATFTNVLSITDDDQHIEKAEYLIEEFKIGDYEITDYSLVIPQFNSDAEKDIATKLNSFLAEAYGATINVIKDNASAEHEIIIGQCNRDAVKTINDKYLYNDFVVEMVDGSLVVTSENNEQLLAYTETLGDEILALAGNSGSISIPADFSHSVLYDYISRKVTLNGVPFEKYGIVYADGNENMQLTCEGLAETILTSFGFKISVYSDTSESTAEYEIIFGDTNRTAKDGPAYSLLKKYTKGENNAILSFDEKYILLYAGSDTAFVSIQKNFTNQIFPEEITPELDITLKSKVVTEITSITVKVMSYNVLNDTVQQKIDQHIAIIKDYNPDVIGFQEIKPAVNSLLYSKLKDKYAFVYRSRSGDGEGTPLYYNKSKYTLVESGTKWISDTPDKFGSKYEDSAYVRIYTYAVLREKKTGIEFTFVNTHLDYVGTANYEQMQRLLELTAEYRDNPIIYTADWNMSANSNSYALMGKNGMVDACKAVDAPTIATCGNSRIDFIFVSQLAKVKKFKTINDHKYSATSSDHYPIYAEVVMTK